MKHAWIFFMLLAANCWGQTSDIFLSYGSVVFSTNNALAHVFTVTTNTVTNTYHPKQWLTVKHYTTYPEQRVEEWVDSPGGLHPFNFGEGQPTRDNPDLRIIECRGIVTARLEWKGKPFSVELENNLLRRWEENWVKEPPIVPAGRWVPGPVQTNWGTVTNYFTSSSTVSVTGTVFSYSFPTNELEAK